MVVTEITKWQFNEACSPGNYCWTDTFVFLNSGGLSIVEALSSCSKIRMCAEGNEKVQHQELASN